MGWASWRLVKTYSSRCSVSGCSQKEKIEVDFLLGGGRCSGHMNRVVGYFIIQTDRGTYTKLYELVH